MAADLSFIIIWGAILILLFYNYNTETSKVWRGLCIFSIIGTSMCLGVAFENLISQFTNVDL